MKNRVKFRTLPALAAFFIMATPLYAESCALARGYDGSSWKRCPKARECPPDSLVDEQSGANHSLSTAKGLTPPVLQARPRRRCLLDWTDAKRLLMRQLPLYCDDTLSGQMRAALRIVSPTLKDAHEEWLGAGVDGLAPPGQILTAIELAGGG